jgi:hypothetical protein
VGSGTDVAGALVLSLEGVVKELSGAGGGISGLS